ncbi:MAG: transposase [Candidatus Omnitrophica bacterium]|nr:transposase [Candidatus Omnitrophota bacterium]
MARLARVSLCDIPYHVTQRGNRRQPVFFTEEDRRVYLHLLKGQANRYGLEVWAYCLMTNHVHLIVVPRQQQALTRAIAETHRRYTRHINFREGWRGYLWQGRFASVPLDEQYLYAAVRYVERNPVHAKLVSQAEDYPWSSARAHVLGVADQVLAVNFLTEHIQDWKTFLHEDQDDNVGTSTGRPLGGHDFVGRLELMTGRLLHRRRPGPKPVIVETR